MSDDKDDVRSGFVRQRRNLIITSLVLLFALIHQVKPIQALHLPGTLIEFARPVSVVPYLVVVFLYFAWRYYVYFRDIGDKGFRAKFRNRLNQIVKRPIEQALLNDSKLQDQLRELAETYLHSHPRHFQSHARIELGNASWIVRDTMILGPISFRRLLVQTSYACVAIDGDEQHHLRDETQRTDISGRMVVILNIRAALYVLMHTRILSEYFLPFGIAALPVLYTGYRVVFSEN